MAPHYNDLRSPIFDLQHICSCSYDLLQFASIKRYQLQVYYEKHEKAIFGGLIKAKKKNCPPVTKFKHHIPLGRRAELEGRGECITSKAKQIETLTSTSRQWVCRYDIFNAIKHESGQRLTSPQTTPTTVTCPMSRREWQSTREVFIIIKGLVPPNLGPEPAILLVSASDDVTQER